MKNLDLSKKLTKIYLNNANDVNEQIQNLQDGSMVIIDSEGVAVYDYFDKSVLHFLSESEIEKLKEDGKLDYDAVYIEIV